MELVVVDLSIMKKDLITTRAIVDVIPDLDHRTLQAVAQLPLLKDRLQGNASMFGQIRTIVGNAKELRIQLLSRIKDQPTADG